MKIDARDIKGARFTVNLSGLPARVFQHEFDHLQVSRSFEIQFSLSCNTTKIQSFVF